jgi:hypothetical protein
MTIATANRDTPSTTSRTKLMISVLRARVAASTRLRGRRTGAAGVAAVAVADAVSRVS